MKFLSRLKELFFPSRLYVANFFDEEGFLVKQLLVRAKNYEHAEQIAYKYYSKNPELAGYLIDEIEEEEI